MEKIQIKRIWSFQELPKLVRLLTQGEKHGNSRKAKKNHRGKRKSGKKA